MKPSSRPQTLALGLLLLDCSAAADGDPVVAADGDPVVETKGGELRGTTAKSFLGNDIFSFKGKKYSTDAINIYLCYN